MVLTRSKSAAAAVQTAQATQTRREKVAILQKTEWKLNRACENVVLLNDRIVHLSRRYYRARDCNHKTFRYNLRLKLAVYEGVRNVFYEYARDRAEEIAEMRRELYNQRVTIISSSDREETEDELDDSTDSDSDED